MKVDVKLKHTDHLVPTPIVHQTAFWGRVYRRLGIETRAFDIELERTAERGDLLIMHAPLRADVECAYVPFGPELGPSAEDTGRFLETLSMGLRDMLGPRCAFIRWDLPWMSLHAREPSDFAREGHWNGPPPNRLREVRMNFGTDEHNLWKAPRDVLPPDTVLIDLRAPEDELLARMHHKTRYNIRLASRKGVVVEEGSMRDLEDWYRIYLQTTARNRIEPMPLEHFRSVLAERGEGSASPVVPRLLLARRDDLLLAGILVALAPSRATYLYGASTREHRELMAPYALQWAAMRLAKAHKCDDYDLFGAAPRSGQAHALAGVHRFKVGFGGELVHREGCWDFPFDAETYNQWRQAEQAQLVRRGAA